MSQPNWKFANSIGDVDPIAYGGGFIYEDTTGVYGPEMSWFDPGLDEIWNKEGGATKLKIYRILLERQPEREWWWKDLDKIASYTGIPIEELQKMASGTLRDQGTLYDSLIRYFGTENFDETPQTMTEDEAYSQFETEMKQTGQAS